MNLKKSAAAVLAAHLSLSPLLANDRVAAPAGHAADMRLNPAAFSWPLASQTDEIGSVDAPSAADAAAEIAAHPEADPGEIRDGLLSAVRPATFSGVPIGGAGATRREEGLSFADSLAQASHAPWHTLASGELFGEGRIGASVESPVPGAVSGTLTPSDAAPESVKTFMEEDLELVGNFLHANYAPRSYKERLFGWNLRAKVAEAKAKVRSTPDLSIKDYWKILRGLIDSPKDYHMSMSTLSTEASVIPFTVKGAVDKKDGLYHYYIVFIDRTKLPKESFPFEVGDELVSFGGKDARDAVKELQDQMEPNKPATDNALASLFLTVRRSSRAFDVPQGPIEISVKRKASGAIERRQMIWEYSPETIEYNLRHFRSQAFEAREQGFFSALSLNVKEMLSPVAEALKGFLEGNPHGLGNNETFMPPLGPKVWETPPGGNFHAYIYTNAEGKKLGYLRIPSYTPQDADAALAEFAVIVKKLEAETEGLVINQTNNPGGSVFYLYALASMLTDQPLQNPKHRVAINPQSVSAAQKLVQAVKAIKNDDQARRMLGPTFGGFPVSYQLVKFIEKWAMNTIEQWNKGNTLTEPTWLYGVDLINPSSVARYTKPILLVVNELDFSGGDFFPFIMALNDRAELFGTETSGAGGFVLEFKYPNLLGIDSIHYTGSNTVVENSSGRIGTRYEITTDDLQNGFEGYGKAVAAAMDAKVTMSKIDAFAKAHFQEIASVPGVAGFGPARFFRESGPTLVVMVDGTVAEDQVRAELLRRLPGLAELPYQLFHSGPIVPANGAFDVPDFIERTKESLALNRAVIEAKDDRLPGLSQNVSVSFTNAAGEVVVRLPLPGDPNPFAGKPMMIFIPVGLHETHEDEDRIQSFAIDAGNVQAVRAFLEGVLGRLTLTDAQAPVVAELRRRLELLGRR